MEKTSREVKVDITLNGINYIGTVAVNQHCDGTVTSEILDLNPTIVMDEAVSYEDYVIGCVSDMIRWEAYHVAECTNVEKCEITGFYFPKSKLVELNDGRKCRSTLAYYFETYNDYYLISESEQHYVRDEDGEHYTRAPSSYFSGLCYCSRCGCYIELDNWDEDYEMCIFCAETRFGVIDGYTESHKRPVVLFGEYKDEDSFVGFGFELEVDCDSETSAKNDRVARGLCDYAGLEKNEMRYAHDGSLNHGFECISQPHTVKDFWLKHEKWQRMLKYLVDNGYKSHDTETCGLHVHVSRLMFGSTKEQQDEAIAKVYTFFDENWRNLVRVSRRRNFSYCDKNKLDSAVDNEVQEGKTTRLRQWRIKSKTEGGHYVALNNVNRKTFEYRLGRGTLNAWSFFSWIDLIVTITNNARRITVSKVNTNDLVSWLGGIKETTAKYIYKRGAFKDTMLTLYPSIAWEFSDDDNRSE